MLGARKGLSPVMVGRSGPYTRLVGLAAEQHRDGSAVVAVITGEAGVGKTRLVQELVGGLARGTAVLAGGAEWGSLGRPFDVARGLLGGPLPPTGDDPVRAVVDAIVERIGDRRAIVVFEDLHWADAESVAVFEALAAARLPSALVVGTCRPDELSRRLPGGEMLERLERRQFVHHLHLDRLRRDDVGAFLASVYGKLPPSGVIDALYGRTGGNPFFLEELLNVAGDLDPAELVRQPLPWSLAELVRAQLDGLSSAERCLVEAAAVLGRRAEFDLLADLTHSTEEELIDHLRALVQRGLLVEECEDSFVFRHALVRDAVEQQLLGRERRRLHEAALQALRASPCEDLAGLAHHARGAGRYDEFVALARDGVAHYQARGSSHQALRLASDALAEAPDDTALLAAAARAAWLVGLYDEALAHVERWWAVARDDPPAPRAAAARLLGRVYHELSRSDDMWRVVAELERLVGELEPGEDRALTMAAVAQLDMLHYRSADAVAWADRAIAEAEAAGAKGVRAQALIERASAMVEILEGADEGEALLRDAVDEAEAVGDWVLVTRGMNNMARYVYLATPEGEAYVARLREASERAGFEGMGAHSYRYRLIDLALIRGDLAESRSLLDALPTPIGPHIRTWHDVLNGLLAVEEGRLDHAERTLAAGWKGAHAAAEQDFATLALALAARRGDRAGAEAIITATTAVAGDPEECHPEPQEILDRLEVLDRLALAHHGGGVLETWRVHLRGQPRHLTVAAEGLLAALEGRHDDVAAHLGPLLDDRRLSILAYQRSWLRVTLARALAATGRRSEGLSVARAARADLARWPGWRRDDVDAVIRRLDGASGVSGADPESDLTAREREVATLLAEGLSNADLARRLYISPKTAAVHVSNILTKLGMSSRAEVAAWAVRSGLAGARKDVASGP